MRHPLIEDALSSVRGYYDGDAPSLGLTSNQQGPVMG